MVQISRLGAAKCRALPRGGGGAGMGLLRQGSEASRARRGRRFGILGKRRCSAWTLAFVALVYLSFFGAKLPFLASQDELVNRESFTEDIVENGFEYIHDDVFGKVNSSSEVDDHHIIAENDSFQSSLGLSKPDLHAYIEWNISHSRTADIFSKIANLYQNRSKLEFARHTKVKTRKHHGPCAIRFGESVDNLVEPENYMNFTKFSLTYTSNEEKLFGNNIFKPRFGGHQALEERENSYYARNQTLHCGFVKGPQGHQSTGFDLNEKDKEYMATCTVVVSSCIFGSSDFLRRPASKMIGAYSKKNVCFMMFLDQLTMTKLSSEGQVPDDKGYIGLWKIIIVKNLPYTDMRKTGKVPKFLSQRLFPSARYSIWIDSKMRLQTDPMLILEYFLWRTKSEYAISNHYDRHCVWDEVIQNKRLNKYNHTAIDEQFLFYQSDGLIRFNESDIHAPLPSYVPEGSFIVRAHTPMSNLFSCLWFNEVDRFTSRDQLSFAYTFLKLRRMNPGKPFFLNMFKDCERRALAKLFHHRVEDPHPPPALR